jgi:PPOX class probable F420-dependent enzyme
MSIDQAREFIRRNHRGVLATRRQDGGVAMVPVLAVADEKGDVLISTWETSGKLRNLRRDPHASVCVFQDQFFGAHAQVDGTVTIETLPGAMEGLVHYYRLAAGEHPDWDDYRRAMERDRRVLLHLHIERARVVEG